MIRRHYVDGKRDYIELPPLFRWLDKTGRKTKEVSVGELKVKEGELDQTRVNKSDTQFPLIAVDGLDEEKRYTLIDGRHRLQKLIRENKQVCDCYILTVGEYRSMITTGE
jgi:hypothetical protein|tara:strand:- start:735 stop:1064 length:330 start_codon:yes stop_codon:yes gene_type:complete